MVAIPRPFPPSIHLCEGIRPLELSNAQVLLVRKRKGCFRREAGISDRRGFSEDEEGIRGTRSAIRSCKIHPDRVARARESGGVSRRLTSWIDGVDAISRSGQSGVRIPGFDGNVVHEAGHADKLEERVEGPSRILAFFKGRAERGELRRGTLARGARLD